MTIKEYMDLINDWNSDVPMNISIRISKALRKFMGNYPQYEEETEFNSDILSKLKDIIIRDNGEGDWEEAFIYIDGFIGHVKD